MGQEVVLRLEYCLFPYAGPPTPVLVGHERERKKKQREKDGGKRGKGKKRQRQSSNDKASASDTETHQPSSSRTRSLRPPSRYRDEETVDSDESDTVCIICGCIVEKHQSKIQLCSGSIVTHVASGSTPTVPWDATQLHVTLFVYPVLRNEKLVPLL